MADIQGVATPAKKRSRTKGLLVFAGIVVVAALGTWGYNVLFLDGVESTDDAQIQGPQAVIASQTLGQVSTLTVDLGDRVTKGQVLATLDDRTQQSQKDQALVAIEQAQANQKQAEANVASSSDAVGLQRVKLDQAKTDLARATAQAKAQVISLEQFEHAQSAFATEKASYDIAVGQNALARAQEKSAEVQRRGAEVQLQTVEANMSHVILTSTIDGVVARRWVVVGDVVQPAQPVYTVVDLDDVWVTAYFKETQLKVLKVGDPVEISADAYPGSKITGKVETLGVTTAAQFALIPQDNTSGNFTKITQRIPVRVSLDPIQPGNTGAVPRLVPGLSVEVSVRTKGE